MKRKHINRRLITRFKLLWSKRFGVAPLPQTLDALTEWFKSPLGTKIISCEQTLIDEHLEDLFGFHLMQLSVASSVNLSQSSRISHKFSLYPKHAQCAQQPQGADSPRVCSAVVDFSHLPLPANSIDLVIAHHLLDYSQNPHHLLREVSNVLVSHGYLLVIGFNPWSLFGLKRWLARWFSTAPQWRHQALSAGRVMDWMRVLDLTPMCVDQGFYFPVTTAKTGSWWSKFEAWCCQRGLPCGGFYLIVARKDTFALIAPKPHWQTYSGFQAWGVTKILGRATRNQKIFNHPDAKNIRGSI